MVPLLMYKSTKNEFVLLYYQKINLFGLLKFTDDEYNSLHYITILPFHPWFYHVFNSSTVYTSTIPRLLVTNWNHNIYARFARIPCVWLNNCCAFRRKISTRYLCGNGFVHCATSIRGTCSRRLRCPKIDHFQTMCPPRGQLAVRGAGVRGDHSVSVARVSDSTAARRERVGPADENRRAAGPTTAGGLVREALQVARVGRTVHVFWWDEQYGIRRRLGNVHNVTLYGTV